jgi:hypothetical protein
MVQFNQGHKNTEKKYSGEIGTTKEVSSLVGLVKTTEEECPSNLEGSLAGKSGQKQGGFRDRYLNPVSALFFYLVARLF